MHVGWVTWPLAVVIAMAGGEKMADKRMRIQENLTYRLPFGRNWAAGGALVECVVGVALCLPFSWRLGDIGGIGLGLIYVGLQFRAISLGRWGQACGCGVAAGGGTIGYFSLSRAVMIPTLLGIALAYGQYGFWPGVLLTPLGLAGLMVDNVRLLAATGPERAA